MSEAEGGERRFFVAGASFRYSTAGATRDRCSRSPSSSSQGAAQGAEFIREQILQAAEVSFDDFAASGADRAANRRVLGLDD